MTILQRSFIPDNHAFCDRVVADWRDSVGAQGYSFWVETKRLPNPSVRWYEIVGSVNLCRSHALSKPHADMSVRLNIQTDPVG